MHKISIMYFFEKYANGVKIIKRNDLPPIRKVKHDKPLKPSRKSVSCFSRRSASRLRNVLLKVHKDGWRMISITCTCPDLVSPIEWRGIMHRFTTNLNRCGLGLVWRVELQRRKVPHLHCVAFVRDVFDLGDYWLSWLSSVFTCHEFFLEYGFVCRFVRDPRWLVYCCSHSVKRKADQLGWQGRQWGIINRKFFDFSPEFSASIIDDSLVEDVVADVCGFDFTQYSCGSCLRFGGSDLEEKIFSF